MRQDVACENQPPWRGNSLFQGVAVQTSPWWPDLRRKEIAEKIVKGWDKLAEAYQRNTRISTNDVHYGPLAYGENRLRLLGDPRGKRTLEIGCGGGQNTIALARRGAEAFGIDPSRKQIEFARRLATECDVEATFAVAPAEDLSMFKNECFDIALSSHAFGYVGDFKKACREACRVLKQSGLFVLCIGNPFYHILLYNMSEDKEEGIDDDYLSYPSVERWDWTYEGEPSVPMLGHERTLSQTINPLLDAGFVLEQMVEQGVEDVPHMSEKEKPSIPYLCRWSESEFRLARKIPYSIILRLRKKAQRTRRSQKR